MILCIYHVERLDVMTFKIYKLKNFTVRRSFEILCSFWKILIICQEVSHFQILFLS